MVELCRRGFFNPLPSLSPRPAFNPRPPSTATPLVDEVMVGTATGAVLALWRQDSALRAQALQ